MGSPRAFFSGDSFLKGLLNGKTKEKSSKGGLPKNNPRVDLKNLEGVRRGDAGIILHIAVST